MPLDIETRGGIPAVDEDLLRRVRERDATMPVQGGIAGLYAPAIQQAVQRQLSNPAPEPEPSWSTWALTKALGSGLVSGGLEYSGSVADLASGAAAPMAATGGSAGGMFALPTDEERRQEEEARQRMLKGPAFNPAIGNVMRAKAGEFAPDPITAHKSAQILHGLSAGVSKAVGSALTFGPVAGAAVFGAEEGNTAAQNLMVAGVDAETAAKVGAVTAVASAVGAGLPVAGSTVAKTAALALTGGPGTYVAQEALSRKILADAGYKAQAEMHDPFDPVMLALSTVIPGAMGALAMRQAARAAARAKAAEPVRGEPARPEPGKETQPVEPAPKAEAEPVKTAPHDTDAIAARAAEDPAAVDAARVRVLDDAEAKHIPPETPPGNERGIETVREAVESGDMQSVVRMAAEQEAARPMTARWYSGGTAGLDELSPELAKRGNLYGPGVYLAKDKAFADTYGRGEGRTVHEIQFEPQKPFDTSAILSRAEAEKQLVDFGIAPQKAKALLGNKAKVANSSLYKAVETGLGGKAEANKAIAAAGFDAITFKSARGDELAVSLKPVKVSKPAELAAAKAELAPEVAPRDVGQPETPGAESVPGKVAPEEPKPATPEQETARLSSAVQDIAEADPNTMVTLPGHETPMKLSDAMELIDQQTKELLQQGDFVKAASTCAIMSGM